MKPKEIWGHGWHHTIGAVTVGCLLLAWGLVSKDSDFYLPDFFSSFAIITLVIFVLSGFIRSRDVRAGILILFVFVPALTILTLECYYKCRTVGAADLIVELPDDLLLRYKFRPGGRATGSVEPGAPPRFNNSRGLNDVEFAVPKPRGVFRIAVLGGSVQNDGDIPHDETAPKRLEALLNSVPILSVDGRTRYRKIEVINVSCDGYNTLQQVRLLEKAGLDYDPDLVVVLYSLTNPFLQNGSYRRFGNSFFLFSLVRIMELYAGKILHRPNTHDFDALHAGYQYELVVANSFERLRLLSLIRGFKVAVAVIPNIVTFENHPFVPLYQKVARTARGQGFDCIVMFDRFRQYPYTDFAKGSDITHPNSAGHKLMADILFDYVLSKPLRRAPMAAHVPSAKARKGLGKLSSP